MFDIESSLNHQILEAAEDRPTIVFVEPLDPRVIEAACGLTRFIRPVFLAPETKVRQVIAEHLAHLDPNRVAYTLSESAFIDIPACGGLRESLAQELVSQRHEHAEPLSLEQASDLLLDPVHFGIMAVKAGHADTVVGGADHGPRDYFRPMIRTLARKEFLCEAGVFVLPDEHPDGIFPHNIVVFGDVGVNAVMTPDTLAQIAVGTCAVARDLIPEDILPEIHGVIVSYSHAGMDEGPAADLVHQATQRVPHYLQERIARGTRYQSIRIQGEVKISAALSKRSAMYYHQPSERDWEGAPNVIICPNLDMGNLLYHLYATRFPQAKKFPVLFSLHFTGVDVAMDATPEDIRLGVKASVLRLHKYGHWKGTPKDTFFPRYRVLSINPGSTSTKLAVFEGDREIAGEEIRHAPEQLQGFESQPASRQYEFRKAAVMDFLMRQKLSIRELDAVVGRGGMLHPVLHGTYGINETMLKDLASGEYGNHPSNLGGILAFEIAKEAGKPSFIVDPVVVDEALPRTKVTGIKAIRRRVVSHALNQIATARRFAAEQETFYEKLNLIVAHLGGGISMGAHRQGRIVDANNGLDGEGPFTPQRSGSLPVGQLLDLCFSGTYTQSELRQLNKGRGGLIDLLGTSDLQILEGRYLQGDLDVVEVLDAMAYQISKWITAMIPAFDGEPIDRILLTGGASRCRVLVEGIQTLVAGTGIGLSLYPGENEMSALAKGAIRVLSGRETLRSYT